jgi:aryl-alcohol dehydrogenase-like predicted oxidoreductase
MEYRTLGRSDVKVSAIGLGTMTFGEQNTEAEGHAQIDYALNQGVNLIDTAEMYSVPPRADTYGSTERIIGTWLKKRGKRDGIVLCTKVAGPTRVLQADYVRGGTNVLDRKSILAAIDSSLQRLQTDYVDVYQLHWPDRSTNFFGQLGYRHTEHEDTVPIEETLEVMTDLVRDGKIRHVGVSNEAPWGLHRFLQLADQRGLARVVSIQNPYNLLNRSFEIGLAEWRFAKTWDSWPIRRWRSAFCPASSCVAHDRPNHEWYVGVVTTVRLPTRRRRRMSRLRVGTDLIPRRWRWPL